MTKGSRVEVMSKKNVWISIYNLILMLILPVLLIAAWYIFSEKGLVNPSILPKPEKVYQAFRKQIALGTLSQHLSFSIMRVLKGYFLGVLIGMTIGILAAISKTVERMLSILIGVFRPIPPIACIPFFVLWLGIKEESKVAVIILGTFWPVLLNTIQGIKNTDKKLLEVGTLFGKNKLQILVQIILPSALPVIFTGWRLGISSAWTCVVAAEMIAASKGVGYLISYGRELAQPALLMVGIISIGIIGLIIDFLFLHLQKAVVYWERPTNQ